MLEPGDQLLQLRDDHPPLCDSRMDGICVRCVSPPLGGDRALHEAAERNACRRRPEPSAKSTPRLVAHLHARHPVPGHLRGPRRFDGRHLERAPLVLPLPSLSTPTAHAVCNVYNAPDGETVCCERSERQECI